MKSNIDTLDTAGINFSCLLCPCRQRLQKICTRSTVVFLGYFDYSRSRLFVRKQARAHTQKSPRQ